MGKSSPWQTLRSLLRGNILVITITRTVGMFARSMAFPYVSLFILALGGNPQQIGLVNTLALLATLLALPVAGYLTDQLGRVRLISWAVFFSGIIYAFYVFAPNWQFVALGAFLRGFTVVQFPPTSALIADSLPPANRGRGNALMNTIAGLPAIVAPYVAGVIIKSLGVDPGARYLFALLMGVYIVNAFLYRRFLQERTPTNPRRSSQRLLDALREAYASVLPLLRQFSPTLKALTGILVLGFCMNALAGPFWVVYATRQIGLSTAQWGLVLLVETALRSVFYLPAGVLADRWGRAKVMGVALVLATVLIPLFLWAKDFWQVLGLRVLFALVNSLFIPASTALLADIVPRSLRGRVMAAIGRGTVFLGATSGGTGGPGLGAVTTIPLIVSSLASGYIYSLNPTYTWGLATLGTLLAAFLCLRYVRDPAQAEE